MLRVLVISAGCALAVTTGALAVTDGSPDVGDRSAAQRQYVFTPPPPPPPPPPPLVVPPPIPPPPPVQQVAVQDIALLPVAKKCMSRRSFGIRLRSPKGEAVIEGRVFVNGKQVRVLRGARLRSKVILVGLPKGRYIVKITVKTKSGKRYSGTRRYRTCTPKRKGGVPKV
jgi:hypothetical protein